MLADFTFAQNFYMFTAKVNHSILLEAAIGGALKFSFT